jgi:hypothetical protein
MMEEVTKKVAPGKINDKIEIKFVKLSYLAQKQLLIG